MEPDKQSRMAELASELIGAKMASEFLKEAWDSASPDAKRQIADSCLRLVQRQFSLELGQKDNWDARAITQRLIVELIEERKEELRERLKRAVDDYIATWTPAACQRAIEDCGKVALETIRRQVTEKFVEAMRGLRA